MYEKLVKRLRAWEKADVSNWRTFKEAADAIESLDDIAQTYAETVQELKMKSQWIPVTERLPEISVPVLAYVYWPEYQDTIICYGTRKKTKWFLTHCEEGELLRGYEVTHWMPLPEPPKEET